MMKKFKTFGISLLVAACAACLSLAFVACKSGDKDAAAKYGCGEEGFYYYDGANSARYMLSLQSGNYMITAGGETQYSGTYSYDEENGEISFDGGDFTATVGDSALSLDMGDSGYSFKAYKYFDVTYVDENGKTVATESVLNGQSAEAISVEKDGYYFIGWYEDSSNSSEFAFNTSIAGDTTVYGWYIEINENATDFAVTFDYGDGYTETSMTQNGAVWTLPSSYNGSDILGWWVSATNKSGELTHRYNTGEVFAADTALFAVYSGMGASVTSAGITWENALGANVSVTVYNGDGSVAVARSSTSSSDTSFAPAGFSSLSAGTYTVEVVSGSSTEYLTYVVNGLSRVSKSSMEIVSSGDGRVLSFAPVENASGYTITIDDGERKVTEDLGSRTYYNLSSWEMTKTGLTITVTAYADGYVSSVSDEYSYLLKLDSVVIEMSGDDFSWSWVDGALGYEVVIYGEDGVTVLESFYTTDTSYSLKYYGVGEYTISVRPVTDGYWSAETFVYGQGKSSIAAPVICDITYYTVTWTAVEGAESYVVVINGETYEVTEGTTLNFSDKNVPKEEASYEIAVMAVAMEGEGENSSYSDEVTATNGGFRSSVRYEKNTIYWNYDISATSYVVSVDGSETSVTEGNSAGVTLNKAGNNEIVVTAYSGASVLGQAKIDVYAYAVILDPNGATFENGTSASSTIYVAQGDTLNLGEVGKDHANFIGWYTQADYTDGQSDVYEGKGSEVTNGTVFTGSRDMYLYAYWSYEYIDVALYVGGDVYDELRIKYNSTSFILPVPAASREEDDFVGWYTLESGAGERYTTGTGVAVDGFAFGDAEVLYACFRETRSYSQTRYNGEIVYSVSAGPYINSVSEMTIPETYNGKNLIINSNAFASCVYLTVLNIPDTVQYISITNDGYRKGTGAFAYCSNLKEINVYATETVVEPLYFSCDGVLFHKTGETEDVEIMYYPYGRELCSYVVPSVVYNETEYENSGTLHYVTLIPSQVFRDRKISEITISSSVTKIDAQAFYDNAELTRVIFEEGGTAELYISDRAFRSCASITEIVLPARYTDFNANAFSECGALVNVYMEDGGVYSSDGGVLLSSDGRTIVYFPVGRGGEVVISDLTSGSITAIGESAFASNKNISSVVVAASVTEIMTSAFENCGALTSVTFEGGDNSESMTIRTRAFYGCTLLTEITLPVNLTVMEKDAFGGCSNLVSVTFEARVGTVASDLDFAAGSFGSLNYITTLTLGNNVPEFDFASVFDGGKLAKVIIMEGGNNHYYTDSLDDGAYTAVYNGDKSTILYYPRTRDGEYNVLSETTKIGSDVFAGRVGLTVINIGASVNTIGDRAFYGCTNLTAIYVDPANSNYGNAKAGESEYDGILYKKEDMQLIELVYCPIKSRMTSVETSIASVAYGAFYENETVKTVKFTATDTFELGAYAFYYASVEGVTLPDCLTYIPAYTFYYCSSLTSVTIPEGVTTIKEYAFYRCSALTGDLTNGPVTLPYGLITIGDYAFYYDEGLAVTIPASVEVIGDYAFYRCWKPKSAESAIVFASGTEENPASESLVIGKDAFYYSSYATGLTIPARVTSIGYGAFEYLGADTVEFEDGCQLTELSDWLFWGSDIETITIPAGITRIGESAFGTTWSLEQVEFEDGSQLVEIGDEAFSDSVLESIEIPASVETIGEWAFGGDVNSDDEVWLEEVTFEEDSQIKSIGSYAFKCQLIAEITIPASIQTIGYGAFEDCEYLETVVFEEGTNGNGLTQIPDGCFSGCESLSSVTLANGLVQLGNGTDGIFGDCTKLTEINIPASVETISANTFDGCKGLKTVKFESGSALKKIGDSAFAGCTALTTAYTVTEDEYTGEENFAFPESTAVTLSLGAKIFEGTGVTSVTLSSNISDFSGAFVDSSIETINLGDNPYFKADESGKIIWSTDQKTIVYHLDTLTGSITGLDGIERIGASAFAGQTGITSVTIPASVKEIGNYAFYGCTSLTEVKFEDGSALTNATLGGHVFEGCTNLASVNLPSAITELPEYFFSGCALTGEVTFFESVQIIGAYAMQSTGIPSISLPDIRVIDEYAFYQSSVVAVGLGDHLSEIGAYSFRECKSLKNFTWTTAPASIDHIFYNCTALETIEIPDTVTTLGNRMFYGCTSLVSCSLPKGLKVIEQYAFNGCSSLTSIIMPAGVTSIGQRCFESCTSLKEVEFSESLQTISGNYAFYKCSSLETVVLGRNVTSVASYAFYQCTSLTYAYTGDSLTEIPSYMFRGCTKLETVEFGPLLKEIGSSAFYGCSALREVTLENGLDSIGGSAFYQCTSLTSIVIPSSVTSVGSSAFYDCTCNIYVENTKTFVVSYWGSETSWISSSSSHVKATAYYYTEFQPEAGDTDKHWHYDENGEPVVW